MKRKLALLAPVALAMGVFSTQSSAQPITDYTAAVKQAVLTNPRVNAAWYNFEATREAQRAAQGGYLPSVDVIADVGREERETPLVDFGDYSRDATRLSITQMLFDGFETRDQVQALGFEKLSQYYELQRASEEIALEASRAYFDTVRYQQLVKAAEDNYIVHRQIYDRIAERTGGGVSQGVDLEQADARIALAESNLLTEMTNLHDVQTRFQRVIGSVPAKGLTMPSVPSSMIPSDRQAALNMAYDQSPVIDAAIENLRSVQSSLNATNAPMMPRLDLRYRNEVEHDTDGFDGRYDIEAIELVLTYNLYRGGSDSARKREFYNLYNSAIEERKQACLNVRQETMIAYNDITALEEQVLFLDRNRLSQDKTRRAYRDQFDIGQRTLLDLLDSQNEYFDTQRAYVAAQTDLLGAKARTLSNMGILLSAMSVEGLNQGKLDELQLDFTRGDDPNGEGLCPPEPPEEIVIDKEALFQNLYGSSVSGGDNMQAVAAVAGLAAGSTRYRDAGENIVVVELNVLFELNSSVVRSMFDAEIAAAAQVLKDNAGVQAIVEGHTDNTGTSEYNKWLSDRRAKNVMDLLIKEHGISPEQIKSIGFGEEHPISDNGTREGREANRRVELILRGG
ncbi:MAG: TolC family outer membrane protein [Halioglobus sp.]